MSLVKTRPDSTTSNNGTLVGGATAHAILSDDSDASYVSLDAGQVLQVAFANPVAPAGSKIRGLSLQARAASYLLPMKFATGIGDGRLSAAASPVISNTVPQVLSLGFISAADLDLTNEIALFTAARGTYYGIQGRVRIYELWAVAHYVDKPVVTPQGPTGAVNNTNTPSIEWTAAFDAQGLGQGGWHVKVFSAAQYGATGFDPLTSVPTEQGGGFGPAPPPGYGSNRQSWKTPKLTNGTYRAYIDVFQWLPGYDIISSDQPYVEFTVGPALPAVPTMAVVADEAAGGIKVTVTPVAGTATTDQLEVQRSLDAGGLWEAVRGTPVAAPAVGVGQVVYDYEVSPGQTVQYRSRAVHLNASTSPFGSRVRSSWRQPGTLASWIGGAWWLKTETQRLKLVSVLDVPSESRQARQSTRRALGASRSVTSRDTYMQLSGSIDLRIDTDAERDALDALLASGLPVLIQSPPDSPWKDRWVNVGDYSMAFIVAHKGIRRASLSWDETERP